MFKAITVTNSFKGYHKYAEAPKEVKFLQDLHRHIFNVKSTIEVKHNNRDLEFYILQQEIEEYIEKKYKKSSYGFVPGIFIESCESLAEELVCFLQLKHPYRYVRVEVWEDNENGAIVEGGSNE